MNINMNTIVLSTTLSFLSALLYTSSTPFASFSLVAPVSRQAEANRLISSPSPLTSPICSAGGHRRVELTFRNKNYESHRTSSCDGSFFLHLLCLVRRVATYGDSEADLGEECFASSATSPGAERWSLKFKRQNVVLPQV